MSDKRGILETISKERITVKIISAAGDEVNHFRRPVSWTEAARTTEITAIAFAGVGSPLKEVVWVVSILKTARRMPAQTGMTEGTIRARNISAEPAVISPVTPAPRAEERRACIRNAGATPKLTMSARLSSSFPISEYAFSILAEKPSRKSKIIAASISQDAVERSPFEARITAIKPEIRFNEVMKFGICLMKVILFFDVDQSKIIINFS
mgnify:CR=1 FL=1